MHGGSACCNPRENPNCMCAVVFLSFAFFAWMLVSTICQKQWVGVTISGIGVAGCLMLTVAEAVRKIGRASANFQGQNVQLVMPSN